MAVFLSISMMIYYCFLPHLEFLLILSYRLHHQHLSQNRLNNQHYQQQTKDYHLGLRDISNQHVLSRSVGCSNGHALDSYTLSRYNSGLKPCRQQLKRSTARRRRTYYHNPTMSFIEKSTALPEIMTLSPTHSQYRIPVREEAWKAVILGLFSLLLQYGAIIQ